MKKTCARLVSAAARFLSQTRGSMAVWTAFLLVPLFGLTGLSLDAGRAYLVKSRLQQALDAAALAAGKTGTTDINTVRDAANFFFKANFPAGYMDAAISGPNVTVENDVIKIDATATIPAIFVHFVGHDNMTVSGRTEVTRKSVYMDVVVSVDISGSMGSSSGSTTRIVAAKNAANTLVDILYGPKEDAPLLKMGLVQWNSMTNVTDRDANYAFNQTTTVTVPQFINPVTGKTQNVIYRVNNTDVPLLAQPHQGWKGCVGARFDIEEPDGYSDDGDLYSGPVTINGASWIAWWPAGTSWNDTVTTQRWNKKKKRWEDVTETVTYTPYSESQCADRPIQRLTTIKGQIRSAISSINQPGGNTNLIEGLGWAWRMLDKESPWTEATVLPNEPGARIVRAIVLMTDGYNTQSSQDAYAGTLDRAALDWRTKAIADRIKQLNNPAINPNADKEQWVIYTIQFAERNAQQEAFMKSLATQPTSPFYQFAPDAAALATAFQEIGNHLSSLRISR
jgi:Flp pilus assembly protein TadG